MNEVTISYMNKQEIESSYHLFNESQLKAAVARLIALLGN